MFTLRNLVFSIPEVLFALEYLEEECPSSPFLWSNLNDFFLIELSLITLNRFLVRFLSHYFITLISSNAVSCAHVCQLLTSGSDVCTVGVLLTWLFPATAIVILRCHS